MNTLKSLSAPVAAIVAVGVLVAILPPASDPSGRAKWQAGHVASGPHVILPVATARGLREPVTTGHAGATLASGVSYVRVAPPSL